MANLLTSSITGSITATGDITAYYSSDERLKIVVEDLNNVMESLSKLSTFKFRWNEAALNNPFVNTHEGPEKIHYGVSAQEVQNQFPDLIFERGDEQHTLSVNYVKLIVPIIAALKEIDERLKALEENK